MQQAEVKEQQHQKLSWHERKLLEKKTAATTATSPTGTATATATAVDPRDEPYVPSIHTGPEHKHYQQQEQHHHTLDLEQHHELEQQQEDPKPPAASPLSGDSIGNFIFLGLVIVFLAWFAGISLLGSDAASKLSQQIAKGAGALSSSKAGGLLHRAASADAYHLA